MSERLYSLFESFSRTCSVININTCSVQYYRACINDVPKIKIGKKSTLLPALQFFRSYNEVFVQTAFIPYYLSTYIDFVCVLCTSNSTASCCCLSFSPSISLCLCSRVPHTTILPFLYLPFYFFAATTKCLYKRHSFPTSLLARTQYYFSICDHGPDSLHAVICDKLTFSPLTGGCSEKVKV